MNLRCLIIDDEPLAHEVIKTYSADISFLTIAGQCYRATEALDILNRQEIDLIFLDIRMPKLSGLDFLRTLQRKPIVIITSAFEEYALESFDLEVCDYLLKPYRFDRFLKAVNRAGELFQMRQQPQGQAAAFPVSPAADGGRISVKSDRKWVLIEISDIFYLESLGNYVKVWKNGEYLLTPRTLGSFEEQLPAALFARVHKSFLLNRNYVDYIEGNTIRLKNGSEVPVGKNYRATIRQLLHMEE